MFFSLVKLVVIEVPLDAWGVTTVKLWVYPLLEWVFLLTLTQLELSRLYLSCLSQLARLNFAFPSRWFLLNRRFLLHQLLSRTLV